ncbi:MAG: MFS transporter [Salinibacter sp.]|uniref:MFS transporter n=1 Tax=Salinibacter sp. TaxID=2065818 RepID=UPI0035D3E826
MNANDRSIVVLVMVGHGLVHTYELSIPIFMTAWLGELGVSEAALGTLVGAGYFLFGAGALPGGILADRFGSQRLIAACLAGMGGAFLLLGLLPGIWGVGAALLAWGAAASVYHPAGLSLISTGAQQRGRALAWHGIAGNVGIAGGPLATALLLLFFDWPSVAILLGLPALGAAAGALRTSVDETAAVDPQSAEETEASPAAGGFSALWARSRTLFASGFAGVFVLVALSGLYYRGMLTFLPDLLTPLVGNVPMDVAAGRYVYAGLLAVGIGGQYTGGRLSDREGTERTLALALTILAGVAVAFLPVAGLGTAALLAISVVLGFFLFVVQPLYQATVAEYTPPDARGLSYGYTYLGVFGVGALGAALAGAVLQIAGPPLLFGVLAGIALLGAGLSGWLALRRPQPESAPS